MSTDTNSRKRKIAGNLLLGIGILGTITCFAYIFELSSAITNMDDPEHGFPIVFFGIPGLIISSFVVAIGLELKKSRESTKALFCGIFSILLPVLGIISGILAIILGLEEWKENPSLGGRIAARAGLVLGIIGTIVWILFLVAWF